MDNYFGSPALENFFLVLPYNMTIEKQSRTPVSRKRIGIFDIYLWQREVPADTANTVNVVLSKPPLSREDLVPLSEVIERTVNDDGVGHDMLIDLDTGRLFTPPSKDLFEDEAKALGWINQNEIDAMGETKPSVRGLVGMEMIAIPIANERWGSMTPAELDDTLKLTRPGTPAVMSAKGELPATFLFKTREGGMGILQIVEGHWGSAPRHMKIRYRMLRHGNARVIRTASDAEQKASDLFSSKGWKLWGQGKHAEAEGMFQKAVEKNPFNAHAWNGLGWAQFNQGRPRAAHEAFEKCLTIEPAHAGALNGLGWVAKGDGKTDEAIAYWERAVAALPSATAALNGLAQIYTELKQHDKAVAVYEQWLQVEPDNDRVIKALEKAREAC